MTATGWLQIVLIGTIAIALAERARLLNESRTRRRCDNPVAGAFGRGGLYLVRGLEERRERHWSTYMVSMLLFHVGGSLAIAALGNGSASMDRTTQINIWYFVAAFIAFSLLQGF